MARRLHGTRPEAYPYGGRYNENRCPAKEPALSRSGRFPACRSYYGLYDMTGNLWEWTATPAPNPDFFMVAGGGELDGGERGDLRLRQIQLLSFRALSLRGFPMLPGREKGSMRSRVV